MNGLIINFFIIYKNKLIQDKEDRELYQLIKSKIKPKFGIPRMCQNIVFKYGCKFTLKF